MRVNISALTIESGEGIFDGTVKVFVHDKEELEELIIRLKQLNGIQSVNRLDTEELA
jgi:GTP pyrophosphokinase